MIGGGKAIVEFESEEGHRYALNLKGQVFQKRRLYIEGSYGNYRKRS